jgi:two-component system, response regulator PdtaR
MATIIIVEDEAIVAMEYKSSLTKQGHSIIASASCAHLALIAFKESAPDIMLIDIKLKGDKDGIELATEIRQLSNTPILFLTGNTDSITMNRLSSISNSSFLGKPILSKSLFSAILKLFPGN